MLRDLMRFDPCAEMGAAGNGAALAFSPAFEVKEGAEGYQYRADVPDLKGKDMEISVTGNRLTISDRRYAVRNREIDRT